MLQHYFMRFAANARFFITAKRRACRNSVVGVNPHSARLHGFCHTDGAVNILRPYCAAKAVIAVVCHFNNFGFVLKLNNHNHRPENFFACHAHIVGNIGNQRRRKEIALIKTVFRKLIAAAGNSCAFCFGNINVTGNFGNLFRVNLRAHLRCRVKRVADFYVVKAFNCFFNKFIVNFFVYKYARACAANLALVEQNAQKQAFHSQIPVAVIKINIGRFAAKLQSSRN